MPFRLWLPLCSACTHIQHRQPDNAAQQKVNWGGEGRQWGAKGGFIFFPSQVYFLFFFNHHVGSRLAAAQVVCLWLNPTALLSTRQQDERRRGGITHIQTQSFLSLFDVWLSRRGMLRQHGDGGSREFAVLGEKWVWERSYAKGEEEKKNNQQVLLIKHQIS